MSDVEVLVTGAGPTGLALALWLARLGIAVRIIEKNETQPAESRALGVQARTLEFYRQLGDLGDRVAARGIHVEGLNMWARGRRAAHISIADAGGGLSPYPYVLTLSQDEHERMLAAELAKLGVEVERGTELVSFTQDANGVRAELSRGSCSAKYLAGCDGARSTVRERLGVGFGGGTYSHLFYVADVNATGPAVDRDIHIDLDEADFLAIFPIPDNRTRLVGVIDEAAVGDEKSFGFDDVSRRPIERMQLQIDRVNWFSTYRVHHRVASSFRRGRVFLLGDAAHIHSPVGAQGMNTGIGDAVNLALKLADVLRGRAGDDLLDTYEIERIAFALRLVATTDRAFTTVSRSGPIANLVRTRVVPRIAPPLFHLRFARRFLFRTVSQIEIRYRHSPISEGKAGRIHGGDRLPWIPDNFAPLRSLAWQAHVYGEAPSRVPDLPLHVFPWSDEARKAGVKRGAVYVVRPDGYVSRAIG